MNNLLPSTTAATSSSSRKMTLFVYSITALEYKKFNYNGILQETRRNYRTNTTYEVKRVSEDEASALCYTRNQKHGCYFMANNETLSHQSILLAGLFMKLIQ